ncbi:uncharacterized protein LOC142817369 [Rhipicephalus microplus]|uniref:uncharacterized protein LOC142817369 n=1 Tax=Rhipicephalus microplus TaxID=6941 RepID=UPI003F6AA5AE
MAAREPQDVPTGSPGTTDKAESIKKGAPPESPECSRPCEAGKGATKSPKERNGSPGVTRSSSQLAPGKGQSSLVSERRSRGSKSEACSATTTTTSTPSRGSSRPAENPGSPPVKAGSLLSTSRVTGRREDVHGATKSPKKKASPGTTLSDSRSLARKGQSSSVSQSRSPSRKSEARSATTTTTSTPSRRSQTSGSPLTKVGSSKSTSRDTGRRDDGHEAAKSPKKGSSGTVSSVSRSPASKRQRSSVTGIESLGRKSKASGGAAAPTSTLLGGSPLPAVAPRLPPTEARSPLSTSRDTELREDDHGTTKVPKSEVSPRTNLSEFQSPASKRQSSRASGTRSTGYSSESRSKTATTLTPSRGSTRPAGVPRLPSVKAGSPQSTNRDSSHSRGNSTPRDTRASNMTPIASVSQAGSQTPLTTPYVTAPSTFWQAGRQTPLTTPYVTAPSTFSQAGSQLPSTTPFVTAPSTSNTPTTPYVSASSRLPHSVEPCADGIARNMAACAATAILHSKSPEADESKSRSRGSSTRSPRSTSSKQGAAGSSGGSRGTRDASKSPKSEHKSPGGEPTTPAQPSAVGKSSAVVGAHDSGGSKLDSSAQARKDK